LLNFIVSHASAIDPAPQHHPKEDFLVCMPLTLCKAWIHLGAIQDTKHGIPHPAGNLVRVPAVHQAVQWT
jgi:hypothetical protein